MVTTYISKQQKRQIFNALVDSGVFAIVRENGSLEQLVSHISNVDELKSQDPRYDTFIGDFKKHCIDNDDWDINTLFVDRMLILETDDVFQSFLEAVVSPIVLQNESEIYKVCNLVNNNLSETDLCLSLFKYNEEGAPIYLMVTKSGNGIIKPKRECKEFHFVVDKAPTGRTDYCGTHVYPQDNLPCFVLVYNVGWDDFGVCSWFDLFWHTAIDHCEHIGPVKIIHKTEMSYEEMRNGAIYFSSHFIPDSFTSLEGEFASLGQEQSYYDRLKRIFHDDYEDVLWALQDCAIYPHCEEAFCNHNQFHSLIRGEKQDTILREEKFIIKGLPTEERYHFSYEYTPKYAESAISLEFAFSKSGHMPHRLYAIIGENGTGKTQFLTKMPKSYAKRDMLSFSPHLPIFSRVLTVSTSIYDEIEEPIPSASFTYDFCGLKLEEFKSGNKDKAEVMQAHLIKALDRIEKFNRTAKAIRVLSKMLPSNMMEDLVNEENGVQSFKKGNVKSIVSKLSSGESCLLITFCDVIANLRNDTLLLFDEPETHLHPKAVVNMMNTLYQLLEEFNSYAIVATHSPLVIREVLADCVFVIKRIGNQAIIGRIKRESFGANIDELNEEIFGQQESNSYYHNRIDCLIRDNGMNYQEIMEVLKSKGVDPSLNLRLFVKNLLVLSEHEED